ALLSAWHDCESDRTGRMRRAEFSHRSTPSSPRVSTRSISVPPGHFSDRFRRHRDRGKALLLRGRATNSVGSRGSIGWLREKEWPVWRSPPDPDSTRHGADAHCIGQRLRSYSPSLGTALNSPLCHGQRPRHALAAVEPNEISARQLAATAIA